MKKKLLTGLIIGFAFVLTFPLVFPDRGETKDNGRQFTKVKFGFVDFEKVFNEYYKTKEGNAVLEKEKLAKEDEGRKLVESVNQMRKEAELLSQNAKEEKGDEIRVKIRELKEFTELTRRDLIKKRNEMWKSIFEEIRQLVKKKGKKEGYTLIFDDKALLFKSNSLDITDEIIRELNKEGKKG